jgi:hypothetical protein
LDYYVTYPQFPCKNHAQSNFMNKMGGISIGYPKPFEIHTA